MMNSGQLRSCFFAFLVVIGASQTFGYGDTSHCTTPNDTFPIDPRKFSLLDPNLSGEPPPPRPKPEAPKDTGRAWLDGRFLFKLEREPKTSKVTAISIDPIHSKKDTERVHQLYLAALGISASSPETTGPVVPASFAEYLTLVKSSAATLSHQQKLTLLSALADELEQLHDPKGRLKRLSTEEVFANLRERGANGGVCRDIHKLISEVATALGFKNVGLHSGLWQQGGDSTAHMISHFVDPSTGEYYVQNYGKIYNTGEKTVHGAVDVSTKLMAPLSGVSVIGSPDNTIHLYQPRTARWLRHKIEDSASLEPGRALIRMEVGNREQTVSVELDRQRQYSARKIFYLHSEYQAPEGPYKVDAIGVSGITRDSVHLENGIIDELGFVAEGYLGALYFRDRPLEADTNPSKDRSRGNVFAGTTIAGTARINRITNKLEGRMSMLDINPSLGRVDFSVPANEFKVESRYESKEKGFSAGVARTWEIGPKSITSYTPKLRTVHDKVDVILQVGKDGKREVYIRNETGLYLMEGIEKSSAVGIKNVLKTFIPTERRGDFTIIYDISAMKNNSDDPFHDAPFSQRVSAIWEKQITKHLRLGTDANYSSAGRPYFAFEEPGSVTPGISNPGKSDLSGNLWLHFKF